MLSVRDKKDQRKRAMRFNVLVAYVLMFDLSIIC